MDYSYKQTNFSRALLGGLFSGLIAVAASQLYNMIFRYSTSYSVGSEYINVQTLIFAPILVCIVGGIIYFILTKFVGKGVVIYVALFTLIMIAIIITEVNTKISESIGNIHNYRGLFIGLTLITGCIVAFALPYLVKHDPLI